MKRTGTLGHRDPKVLAGSASVFVRTVETTPSADVAIVRGVPF